MRRAQRRLPAPVTAAPGSAAGQTRSADREPLAPGAWRWVFLLMAASAVSVVDHVGIGLLVTPIKRDLALSDTLIGLIQGAAYGLFYIGLSLPLGALVDRRERRLILVGGLVVWSLATFASGLARGGTSLFAARLLVGAGEATLTPASVSLIADLFPERRRPLAYGIFTVGVGLGIGIAFPFVGGVLANASAIGRLIGLPIADWRLAFFGMALPGVVLALAIFALTREPRRGAPPAARAPAGAVFRHIARAPAPFAAIIVGAAMLQLVGTVVISWFPTVLVRSYGMPPARIGIALGLVAILIGIPSALGAGWLVARLSARHAGRAPFIVLGAAMVCYPAACIAALLASGPGVALACFAGSVLFSNWAYPAAMSGLALMSPAHLRGRMVAILMMMIGIVSLGIGPALTGLLADALFPATPRGIAYAASLVSLLAAIVGLALLAAGQRGVAGAIAISDAREDFAPTPIGA